MNWLVGSILFFLAVSILLYVILAGADFGAGILELFPSGRSSDREAQQKLTSRAMAPVWEANHVWLVLAVVILFVGFPAIYTSLTVYFHIPLLAILAGIVVRGSAFTFRHYDDLDRKYYRAYSRGFSISSLWTSFFLGVVAGACILGRVDPSASDYHGIYLAPWLNFFCVTMGIFTCSLFAFLAAAFLVGETPDESLRRTFRRKAAWANLALVLSGALIFGVAEASGLSLVQRFFQNRVSLIAFAMATVFWIPLWIALRGSWMPILGRLLGAAIVGWVLLGWFAIQFPVAVQLSGGESLSFLETVAPPPTMKSLLWALLVGSCVIFPALGYLFKVFKWDALETPNGRRS